MQQSSSLIGGVMLLLVTLFVALLARWWQLVNQRPPRLHDSTSPSKTMVVLGSGGHTAEMLVLMDKMDKQRYSPRTYVVAATDALSGGKADAREQAWQAAAAGLSAPEKTQLDPSKPSTTQAQQHRVQQIPRSREVGQSYVTSVATTLRSLAFAARVVWSERPQLILVNGPGTCIPICAAAFAYSLLGLRRSRIVYVESIARTRRFSLSAKILYHSRMADIVFVQWQSLLDAYPRACFAGRLY